MNVEEAARLIRFIETTYNREAPADAATAWALVLADVPYAWARDGALDLMKDHPFWPTPADVRLRARKLADQERAQQERGRQLALGAATAEPVPPPPATGPAIIRAMLAEIAAQNKGVTDRAQRRVTAQRVALEFRDRVGAAADRPGTPCTSKTCRCTHTEGCDAGWINAEKAEGDDLAFPCPLCNPRRHTVLTSGSNRDGAQRALRDTSDVKASEGEAW